MKRKKIDIVYNWLSHPYRLIIRNEDTMAQKLHIRTNYGYLGLFIFAVLFFCVFAGVWAGSRWASRRTYSGRQDISNRRELIRLATKTDSLAQMIEHRDLALKNLQLVINGGKELFEKPVPANLQKRSSGIFADTYTAAELVIRNEFEQPKTTNTANKSDDIANTSQTLKNLKIPIQGLISARFSDSVSHFGVDLVAGPNAPIFAVGAGVIILAQWNPETGYVVCIQHKGGLVSVYKHNSLLIAKAGQRVVAGQPIAIIGNSGRLSTGAHLHFEMWLNGHALDPAKYIKL